MANYRRGINRTFVLASIAWIAFALYLPLREANTAQSRQSSLDYAIYDQCLKNAIEEDRLEGPSVQHDRSQRCREQLVRAVQVEDRIWSASLPYSSITGWLLLIGLCVVPPLIVYLLGWGLWSIGRWVVAGFRGVG